MVKTMLNDNYVIFEILGVKHNDFGNSFVFTKDAVCEISNDQFIRKVVVSADISNATIYLHNSLEITDETSSQIVNSLYQYLGSMMISLLKNSSQYSSVSLKPTIRLSAIHFSEKDNTKIVLDEYIQLRDSMAIQHTFDRGDDILEKWIQDVDVPNYTSKNDKYDILFLLLQGENTVQKYMAMYAYLLSLVKEIYLKPKEGQKQVVQYVTDNCSRVGIKLFLSQSTRPGAKPTDKEDQFTSLRNKIGHPSVTNSPVNVSENAVNGLASIICCAIEDIPS